MDGFSNRQTGNQTKPEEELRDAARGRNGSEGRRAADIHAAIKRHDPAGILEALTKQRPTFTLSQLESALRAKIHDRQQRAELAHHVLDHADTVWLADDPGGAAARYTTRAVLEEERQVLRTADTLARNDRHSVRSRAVAHRKRLSPEQQRAVRHATGASGLAVIIGRAGTGKSVTLEAIRAAYEATGYRVIGLGPTNAVAADLRSAGFTHAATIHKELHLRPGAAAWHQAGRCDWNARTVILVDEAAMIDTKIMDLLTTEARAAGAKLILAGDDRQLPSIARGGLFSALSAIHGAAVLTEVWRQRQDDECRASLLMADDKFGEALAIYEKKKAIRWLEKPEDALAALTRQWAEDSLRHPNKSRFVFAYTNDEVAALNAALRTVRRQRGELGQDHEIETVHGRLPFAVGDRIQFTGNDTRLGIVNGASGRIETIEGTTIALRLDGPEAAFVTFDAAAFAKFRHGYAGTIHLGQGRTFDETYLLHSRHWRSAASYVALTRHRDKTALFVSRTTARSLDQLARQMARSDECRAASVFHPVARHLPETDDYRTPYDSDGQRSQDESGHEDVRHRQTTSADWGSDDDRSRRGGREDNAVRTANAEGKIPGQHFHSDRPSPAASPEAAHIAGNYGQMPLPTPSLPAAADRHTPGRGPRPSVVKRALREAAQAVTRPGDAPKPQTRRQGKTGGGLLHPPGAFTALRRLSGKSSARGRYAVLAKPASDGSPSAAGAAVRPAVPPVDMTLDENMYSSNTIDWLNLWQANSSADYSIDSGLSPPQDQHFPQP